MSNMCDNYFLGYIEYQLVMRIQNQSYKSTFDICLNSLKWVTTHLPYPYYVEFITSDNYTSTTLVLR